MRSSDTREEDYCDFVVQRSPRRTSVVCFYRGDGSVVISLRKEHWQSLQRHLGRASAGKVMTLAWLLRHMPAFVVVERRGVGVARA